MNDRQEALHNYLMQHPFEYTKRVDLLCALKKWYYEENVTELDIRLQDIYFSNEGSLLNKDIQKLKYESSKIIIGSSRKGIKYATKDEFIEWRKRKREAIARECMLLNTQSRKYDLEGQLTLSGEIVESVVE